jgi:putative NADH-flavin reductase
VKITVFGSTGKAGREILRQALGRGHTVVAYARNPGKIKFTHKSLSVLNGELEDVKMLESAITGSDCIISVLGPIINTRGNSLSNGVKNIVDIAEKNNVRRLVQLATPSVADPFDKNKAIFQIMVAMIKTLLPDSYAEIVRIGDIIRASKLDWTLVRVPLLNEKPRAGKIISGYIGKDPLGIFLSRADLAWFMLEQAEKGGYVRQAPVISN